MRTETSMHENNSDDNSSAKEFKLGHKTISSEKTNQNKQVRSLD